MPQPITFATPLDAFSPNAVGVENAYDTYQREAVLVNIDGEFRELAVFDPQGKQHCEAYDLTSPIVVRNAGDNLLSDDAPSLHAPMSMFTLDALEAARVDDSAISVRINKGTAPRTYGAFVQVDGIDITLTVTLTRPQGSALNGIGMAFAVSSYTTDDFSWATGDTWPDHDRPESRIPRTVLRKISDTLFTQLL